jgi:hypothetical protein
MSYEPMLVDPKSGRGEGGLPPFVPAGLKRVAGVTVSARLPRSKLALADRCEAPEV